jgi:hypothetical protein
MIKKNLLQLAEYWHKHYEHTNFSDYREYGKTIRRAMDAGQRSAVILRISCTIYVLRESSEPIKTPRGTVYHMEDKPVLSTELDPLIDWIERQQGLQWKLGLDVLSDVLHPIMSNYADFVVYWQPIYPMSSTLKDYWLLNRGSRYDIVHRAMECGQKYAIIETLYAVKDYDFDTSGYADGTVRSYRDLSNVKGTFSLKIHNQHLCKWVEEQGLKWFVMLDDSIDHGWGYFTVFWD